MPSKRVKLTIVKIINYEHELGSELFLTDDKGKQYLFDYGYNYTSGLMFLCPSTTHPLTLTAELRGETPAGRPILFNPRIVGQNKELTKARSDNRGLRKKMSDIKEAIKSFTLTGDSCADVSKICKEILEIIDKKCS